MGARRYRINLPEQEREVLRQLTRKRTAKQSVVKRAKIILMADAGEKNQDIAAQLGVRSHMVSTWTKRWREKSDEPVEQRLGIECLVMRRSTVHPDQDATIGLARGLGFIGMRGSPQSADEPAADQRSKTKLQSAASS